MVRTGAVSPKKKENFYQYKSLNDWQQHCILCRASIKVVQALVKEI